MRKKVLALGLCAAMAASSLAGCSSSDSGSGNAGNEKACGLVYERDEGSGKTTG